MRHRKRGRKLGRNPSHQRALLRNLASALFLTERDALNEDNAPKVKGRIVTTLHKAKEVRPLVEKCVTIARRALPHEDAAEEFAPSAERHSDAWREWRGSDQWRKWNQAMAPAVAARRRVLQLIGDRDAVEVLFDDIAPRMADRKGGYTRILRLAKPRLGDSGTQAILEFVGRNDRERRAAERPAFETTEDDEQTTATAEAPATDAPAAEEAPADEQPTSAEQTETGESAEASSDQSDDSPEKTDEK